MLYEVITGFKIIKKYVRRFKDEDGNITTKANADMDLAIDALLQARNLDRIILVTRITSYNVCYTKLLRDETPFLLPVIGNGIPLPIR